MLLQTFKKPVGGVAHRRAPYFRTKKVGILGRTQNVVDAPFHDESWTLTSHTSAREFCKREPDWYFDLHRPECFQQQFKAWNATYYDWLRRLQTPIFMQEESKAPWNEIPMAVRYPFERVMQESRPYFTNHPAYMIALALQEGVEQIGIWGCQYGTGSEYATQRGSLEYWLGYAEARGVDIILPIRHNTVLGWPKELYGYESHDDNGLLVGGYKDGLKKQVVERTDGKIMPLTITDPNQPSLTPLPNGDPIAWDRRAKLFPNQVIH